MTCRPGLHTCGALGIAAVGRMDLAAQMAADCEERMMDEELVERVARAMSDAESHVSLDSPLRITVEHERYLGLARAVIPIIAAHEREQCARVAEEYRDWHTKHDDGLSGFCHMALGADEVADRIRARGDA
jgi:hypothetical protein